MTGDGGQEGSASALGHWAIHYGEVCREAPEHDGEEAREDGQVVAWAGPSEAGQPSTRRSRGSEPSETGNAHRALPSPEEE